MTMKRRYLRQIVLSRESWAFLGLHQTASGITIHIAGRSDTNIASALLHDDAENNTLFNTNCFGGCIDGIPNAADILAAVSSRVSNKSVANQR
jgi:hypothetical protein